MRKQPQATVGFRDGYGPHFVFPSSPLPLFPSSPLPSSHYLLRPTISASAAALRLTLFSYPIKSDAR
jgi:hypothetical protein